MRAEELLERLREAGIQVPPSGLLSAAQAAAVLGRSVVTLERWRMESRAPHAVRLNGRYHYDIVEVAAYLTAGDEAITTPQKPSQPPATRAEPDSATCEPSRVRKCRSCVR